MEQPQNPYTAGDPVGKTSCFVGRGNILRDIERFLKHRSQNAVTLYGQRRIGKTSILQYLEAHLASQGTYQPFYFDLMGKANMPLGEILRDLARTVALSLDHPDPNLGNDPRKAFQLNFLPAIIGSLQRNTVLVFLLDEFDVLADPEAEQEAKRQFFEYQRDLRKLFPGKIKFIFGLGRNLDDLDNLAKGLFKDLQSIRVSLLDFSETEALVRISEHNQSLEWTDEAVKRVWEWTSGHPYLTQALCSNIWDALHDAFDSPPPVSSNAVDDAVAGALAKSQNMFIWLWEGLGPAERIVAAALAAAGPIVTDEERLRQILNASGVRILFRELREAPYLLQRWDILSRVDDGYRFSVEMLRRWISENRPLSRAQDELDRIQPAAETLYLAAYDLYRKGDLQNTENVLKQALVLNPNHIRANELLAEMLIAKGALNSAVIVLENLEKMFPGTGSERLKQVYEQIGEQNLKLGDLESALDAFQKAGVNEQINEIRNRLQADRPSTRPALIIGLGGTGQWVLTFLKKELLEIGGGKMPLGIKLLEFDTMSAKGDIQLEKSGPKQNRDNIGVGSVSLEEWRDFINIGYDIGEWAEEIVQRKQDYLRWFPAKSLLAKIPRAAFNTSTGSGTIRQMGRISLFRDLSLGPRSRIATSLSRAISELRSEIISDKQIEVIIVGSLSGGTGAGMLVDMALLVRSWTERFNLSSIVRGFLVLPNAFSALEKPSAPDVLARAFAAWRELDRFMIMGEYYGLRQVQYYDELNPELRINIDRRVFDVSYLVDPGRAENSLAGMQPHEGIFPAIAETIYAILDNKTVKGYSESITTNQMGKLANLPRHPYHSAIGSYSFKLPVFYEEEKYVHNLSLEVLRMLLNNHIYETKEPTVDRSFVDMTVNSFLTSHSLIFSGEQILNTNFLPLVAQYGMAQSNHLPTLVRQFTKIQMASLESPFLRALIDISEDEVGKAIFQKITTEIQFSIKDAIPSSRDFNQSPSISFNRITSQANKLRQEHFGLDTPEGLRMRGKFGEALEQAKQVQTARFQKMLRLWLLTLLNDHEEARNKEQNGGLSFVHNALKTMSAVFISFRHFLEAIQNLERENFLSYNISREVLRSALESYERNKDKFSLWTFWNHNIHPNAYRSEENYLRAVQREINARKEIIFIEILMETIVQMNSIVEDALAEIENWISYLGKGDSKRAQGLYTSIQDSLLRVQTDHEKNRQMRNVYHIIDEHESEVPLDQVKEFLQMFRWEIDLVSGHLVAKCSLLQNPFDQSLSSTFLSPTDDYHEENDRGLLLHSARNIYYSYSHPTKHFLVNELKKLYPNGDQLARNMVRLASPMYTPAINRTSPEGSSCYVSAQIGSEISNQQYFREFEKELRFSMTPDGISMLVDSQDPNRMTIICSDDLMPSASWAMWNICKDAYLSSKSGAELHIFPAEINAIYYEQLMPKFLATNRRILCPEVVALLEDRERLEMFFRAYALGLIRVESKDKHPSWFFSLDPERDKNSISLNPPSQYMNNIAEKSDIFQVIQIFVLSHQHSRTSQPPSIIDWTKLRDSIRARELANGKDVSQRYQFQLEDPEGLVSIINNVAESKSQHIQTGLTVDQKYTDLADLAKIIYRLAIEFLDQQREI